MVRPVGRTGAAPLGKINLPRVFIPLIVGPHAQAQADLLQVIDTANVLGFRFATGQRRQQQAGQDGDNGDDHEEFDQGEGRFTVLAFHK